MVTNTIKDKFNLARATKIRRKTGLERTKKTMIKVSIITTFKEEASTRSKASSFSKETKRILCMMAT